jgi:galactokinase
MSADTQGDRMKRYEALSPSAHGLTGDAAEVERLRALNAKDYAELVAHVEEAESLRQQLRGAVTDFERVGKLAAWLIRDRREFDKVTAYAGELEALAARHARGQ